MKYNPEFHKLVVVEEPLRDPTIYIVPNEMFEYVQEKWGGFKEMYEADRSGNDSEANDLLYDSWRDGPCFYDLRILGFDDSFEEEG